MLPQVIVAGAFLGGAFLVAKYAFSDKNAAPTPTPTPMPLPYPPPGPLPPVPRPPTDPAALLAQAAALAQQAIMNPMATDPAQLEAVALQLDAAGYPSQANQLRVIAQQVRASRGMPPATNVTAAEPPAAQSMMISPFGQV